VDWHVVACGLSHQDIGDARAQMFIKSYACLTEDPYGYIEGCLDGSKTIYLVADCLLSQCNFVILFAKGAFKPELIPSNGFGSTSTLAAPPFCILVFPSQQDGWIGNVLSSSYLVALFETSSSWFWHTSQSTMPI
jgi:hypothetical protein